MNDKPVPPGKPRTVHGIGMDAASTFNFQSLGPKTKAAATRPSGSPNGYTVRNDSSSTANFQAMGRKAAPANASTNTKPAAPAPTKTGAGGKGN